MRVISLNILLYFLLSCGKKPIPQPLLKSAAATVDSLFANKEVFVLDSNSYLDLKQMVFRAFQMHQKDPAYERFSTPIDTIKGEFLQAQIKIGHLFHPSLKSAILGWSSSDSTVDIEIFHLMSDSAWKPCLTLKDIPSTKSGSTSLRDSFLFCKDYNYDGWKDFEVVIDTWDGIGYGYRSRLWLSEQDQFRFVKHFEDIDSPEPDPLTRQIYSYLSGGCQDMAMHFSTWILRADAVFVSESVDIDCCVGQNGKCLITKNHGKATPVEGSSVHLYVPKYFRADLKEKMGIATN